jgi:hypothetical protein
MNNTLNQINEHAWGQFIDIEKNIVYIPPNNDIEILYVITSLTLFQIFILFLIFEYLFFG